MTKQFDNSFLCVFLRVHSARKCNLEVPVYFLKAKQEYTVRKMKKKINGSSHIPISAGIKFRNKKKFWYGIPAHFEH
jgi:hypothetical protein